MRFSLSARKPFSLRSVVDSHGWRDLAPFRYDAERPALFYVDQLSNGHVIEYQITESPGGVALETARLGNAEKAEASDRLTWMLGLDMDFSAFHRAARGEPKLAHVRRTARGRVLRSPTLYEDVVKTILTTNTLWAATKRMNWNLIQRFGSRLPGSEKRAFPSAAAVASAARRILREKIRVGYRAEALHQLARRVSSGKLDLEALKHSDMPTTQLRDELLKIRGVGPYAAANLLQIIGRADFIPIDTWALKLVSHEWYRGRAVTPAQVEKRFARWGEFKGLAFWFWNWDYQG